MRTEYIESFLQVCTYHSFVAAAQAQFITQSTLSARIHSLEEELGVTLFYRGKKGASLTADGKRFLPYAQHLLDTYQRILKEFNQDSFELSIGCLKTLSESYLIEVLEKFYHRYPNATVHTTLSSSKALGEAVLSGQCSFAFVHQIDFPPELQVIPVFEEPIYLVVSPGHRFLSLMRPVSLKEIAQEPLLVKRDPTPLYWKDFLQKMQDQNLTPNIALNSDSFRVILAMVKARKGIGLVSQAEFAPYLKNQSLCTVPFLVDDSRSLKRSVCCIARADTPPNYMNFFLYHFREINTALTNGEQ